MPARLKSSNNGLIVTHLQSVEIHPRGIHGITDYLGGRHGALAVYYVLVNHPFRLRAVTGQAAMMGPKVVFEYIHTPDHTL